MPHLSVMGWDYKDQLSSASYGTVTSYYVYDAGGQRVRKVIEKTGGIKEERYYLGNYEVYRKFVGITLETERTTVAVADDKRKIATIDKLTVDKRSLINLPVAVIRYQYDNHLGSASLELDATAQIISYEEYHPFGTTSYRSGKSETEVSLKRYKYVGKERDEETGLYYYGFRYYAPWIARFINVDPLQHEYPHYTPFQYAGNKPVTYVDLDGLEEYKANSLFGGTIQIPINSITSQTDSGKVLSFISEGQEYWFDPSTKWYSTLSEREQYDPMQFASAEGAPRYLKAALNEYENLGPANWELWWNSKDEWARVGRTETYTGQDGNTEMNIIAASKNIYTSKEYPEVGTGESAIPIWGSGKQAIYNFQDGEIGSGIFNSAMAVSDVFLAKSIVKGIAQGGLKAMGKNFKTWSSWRKFYGESGFAKNGQDVHHWLLNKGGKSGSGFGWWAKNQMWNLKPMKSVMIKGTKYEGAVLHKALHGNSNILRLSGSEKAYYRFLTTPNWLKLGASSTFGHSYNLMNN